MKISFVVNNICYGGAEKVAVFVANHLMEKGHKVCMISLSADQITTQKLNPDLKVYYCHDKSKSLLVQYFIWIKFVVECSHHEKSDVLISFLGIPNLVCVLSSWLLHKPSIISERGDPYRSYDQKKISTRLILNIVNKATGAVFQTSEASHFYAESLRNHSCIIPNPVFIDGPIYPRDYANMPHTIVYLGRLDNYQKRLDILLDGFKLFKQNHKDYKLVIYGSGPARHSIESFVQNNSLSESVILKGVSLSPQRDISNEGIFIITSDFEGISNSLLEAMAIGMPVITTDHTPGGGRFLVKNRKNGLLIPCGDADAVSYALSEFADNVELCKACGLEAQKVLARFAPSKIINTWNTYITNVVNSTKK